MCASHRMRALIGAKPRAMGPYVACGDWGGGGNARDGCEARAEKSEAHEAEWGQADV